MFEWQSAKVSYEKDLDETSVGNSDVCQMMTNKWSFYLINCQRSINLVWFLAMTMPTAIQNVESIFI